MRLAALSPASLAKSSARHPWWTVSGWIAAVVLALGAAALFLGNSLTTAIEFTNKPEAQVADDLITARFFPPGPRNVTEIVYVHSNDLTVDDPAYRDFVNNALAKLTGLGSNVVTQAASYYQTGLENMVSLDRHSTGIVLTLVDDYPDHVNRATYLDAVGQLAAGDGRFDVYPLRAPGTSRPEMVIVESSVYPVNSPEFRTFVEGLFLKIAALGRNAVSGAVTYYATGDSSLVSKDGTATAIPVVMNHWSELPKLLDIVQAARASSDFQTYITGAATIDHDFTALSESDLRQGEFRFGLPAAIIVLVLVFGAIVAALVPLGLALISIAVALGLAGLVGIATNLSVFLVNMIFMMGLAVGIDYSLFIIARFREERANGRDVESAIARAGSTASRAVLFSGATVVLALVGMLLVPTTIFFSLGLGAILVVVVTIIASLTLLPAILKLLGDRINRLRIPYITRSGYATREGGIWERVANNVMRAPVVWLVVSAGVMIVLALPLFGMKTGSAGVSSFPDSFESKKGFEVLQAKFDTGTVTPTSIVVDGDVTDPKVRAAIDALKAKVNADPEFGPVTEQISSGQNTAWLQTPVTTGDATSDAAISAVKRLRNDYIPSIFAGVPARALVTGETAGNIDWYQVANDAAPVVFPFVLLLSFVLLMLVFRSVVVPLKAIVMNLLSVGAAYGLLVLVFERGVGNEIFGFHQVDTIEAWIPVFLFSVLFGLSMDYHVFLLSRIREHYVETGDNRGSVAFGLRSTGRLITGAALIMVGVFGGFASGNLVMFQQMGFGLAVAVLLDATLVRSILVPASMRLLGRWNWYLPGFLQWLPHLNIEGQEDGEAPEPIASRV